MTVFELIEALRRIPGRLPVVGPDGEALFLVPFVPGADAVTLTDLDPAEDAD